eukprot:CAMPEP_0114566408 /NCGR_PEP_ID=MMETSP0114-20121206/14870_1 /TAXON_ID=31324 /ORGANISM="Goniomonas sp, Strain m" /LENGTH=880 /DNA_ID=CAMNT_0001752805 /DNA_START=30 /DNA_END=2672 /DNA_ORIENTATION=+
MEESSKDVFYARIGTPAPPNPADRIKELDRHTWENLMAGFANARQDDGSKFGRIPVSAMRRLVGGSDSGLGTSDFEWEHIHAICLKNGLMSAGSNATCSFPNFVGISLRILACDFTFGESDLAWARQEQEKHDRVYVPRMVTDLNHLFDYLQFNQTKFLWDKLKRSGLPVAVVSSAELVRPPVVPPREYWSRQNMVNSTRRKLEETEAARQDSVFGWTRNAPQDLAQTMTRDGNYRLLPRDNAKVAVHLDPEFFLSKDVAFWNTSDGTKVLRRKCTRASEEWTGKTLRRATTARCKSVPLGLGDTTQSPEHELDNSRLSPPYSFPTPTLKTDDQWKRYKNSLGSSVESRGRQRFSTPVPEPPYRELDVGDHLPATSGGLTPGCSFQRDCHGTTAAKSKFKAKLDPLLGRSSQPSFAALVHSVVTAKDVAPHQPSMSLDNDPELKAFVERGDSRETSRPQTRETVPQRSRANTLWGVVAEHFKPKRVRQQAENKPVPMWVEDLSLGQSDPTHAARFVEVLSHGTSANVGLAFNQRDRGTVRGELARVFAYYAPSGKMHYREWSLFVSGCRISTIGPTPCHPLRLDFAFAHALRWSDYAVKTYAGKPAKLYTVLDFPLWERGLTFLAKVCFPHVKDSKEARRRLNCRIFRYSQHPEPNLIYSQFSQDEVQGILKKHGWCLQRVYQHYAGLTQNLSLHEVNKLNLDGNLPEDSEELLMEDWETFCRNFDLVPQKASKRSITIFFLDSRADRFRTGDATLNFTGFCEALCRVAVFVYGPRNSKIAVGEAFPNFQPESQQSSVTKLLPLNRAPVLLEPAAGAQPNTPFNLGRGNIDLFPVPRAEQVNADLFDKLFNVPEEKPATAGGVDVYRAYQPVRLSSLQHM